MRHVKQGTSPPKACPKGCSPVTQDFATRMSDVRVRKDTKTLADFIGIYCRANHADRERTPAQTEAASLGVYGRKAPALCAECAAHLEYGEKRRAFCPKDPKPFCAHCDVHCYRTSEAEWQRQMMRYSGPRSMLHGHAIDGVKHALEACKYRKNDRHASSAETTRADR